MSAILETSRLKLRHFRDEDLENFVAYRADPRVARYQGWKEPFTREDGIDFINTMKDARPAIPGTWFQFAIELKNADTLIGDCAFFTLKDEPRQAMIGYTLANQHQGKGYATEAVTCLLEYLFGEIGMRRVTAICDVENDASVKLLERIGLRREAHHIENTVFKGRLSSEYTYALLNREWDTLRRHGK